MWHADFSSACSALDEQGSWFGDDAVTEDFAAGLRGEILAAHAAQLLTQSGNHLAVRSADGQRRGVVQEKRNIFEADVVLDGVVARPDLLERCPQLAQLLAAGEAALRRELNAVRPELALDGLEQAKVQVNSGAGGAFPHHFDVPAAKEARRCVTALLYLNPDWQEGDGGEVELLPFPFANQVLPPLDRRLVVFSSLTTMHRVRPFFGVANRVCVNLWFEGAAAATPFPAPLPPDAAGAKALAAIRSLRTHPQELRAFCKVFYRDAIAESFREAFEPTPQLEAAIALHLEEAAEVESRIARATLEALRDCFPLESQLETVELGGIFDGI